MNLGFMFGAFFDTSNLGQYAYLKGVIDFLNMAVVPITITLSVAAGIFAAILGFMIVKAETADRADELKKRMWGLIWTVVIVVIFCWLLGFVLSNFNNIMTAIRKMGAGL